MANTFVNESFVDIYNTIDQSEVKETDSRTDNHTVEGSCQNELYQTLDLDKSKHEVVNERKSLISRNKAICAFRVILTVVVIAILIAVVISFTTTTKNAKVDGGWSSWEDWGSCSVSCGIGMKSRNRTCSHPVAQGSVVQCPGQSLENKLCFPGSCSTKVDGGWSSWEDWGSCSVSCGIGMKSRNRTCSHPVAQGSGVQCPGPSHENTLCFPGSCSNSCQSHPCHYGNCRSKGDSFECLCFLGYTGLYCENEIDECATQPCLNGSCNDLVNGYSCSCFAGFSGMLCQTEIDECATQPCLNGSCSDLVNGYSCSCFTGFSGIQCQTDINECVSNPCLHGTCTDLVNGYNCTCFDGYSGLDCQTDINECGSNPCLHGSCTDLVDGYNCTCFAGYSGLSCQTDIDECSPDPCINGTCIDGIGNYSCSCNEGYDGTDCEHLITDCAHIRRYNGSRRDGIYTVRTWKSHQLISVYCDMTTDGGGWTVFQNRFDGSIDFYRNFSEYEGGFGNLTTEFWLGLSNIQELSGQGQTSLRIDLEAADGTKAYETFESFYLSSGPAYTLHLGTTSASSGISNHSRMHYHNGSDFSTFDHDADSYERSCSITFGGAWWYKSCYQTNLNGLYLTPGTINTKGMVYHSFLSSTSLKASKMMMRRS